MWSIEFHVEMCKLNHTQQYLSHYFTVIVAQARVRAHDIIYVSYVKIAHHKKMYDKFRSKSNWIICEEQKIATCAAACAGGVVVAAAANSVLSVYLYVWIIVALYTYARRWQRLWRRRVYTIRQFNLNSIDFKCKENLARGSRQNEKESEQQQNQKMNFRFRCTYMHSLYIFVCGWMRHQNLQFSTWFNKIMHIFFPLLIEWAEVHRIWIVWKKYTVLAFIYFILLYHCHHLLVWGSLFWNSGKM